MGKTNHTDGAGKAVGMVLADLGFAKEAGKPAHSSGPT